MIKVVVLGVGGRMGTEVSRSLLQQHDMELVGGVERRGHPLVGSSLGSGLVVDDMAILVPAADVVVDFSVAHMVSTHVRACVGSGKPYVTGVTGLSDADAQFLRDCSVTIPVVYSPNFSVGVAVLNRLACEAVRLLGSAYDISILEIHHRGKLDSPSGTARMLAASLQRTADSNKTISISAIRTGDAVGEHRVIFGGAGERIELTHKAESRAAFVTGVIASIRFAASRQRGFYSLDDVILQLL